MKNKITNLKISNFKSVKEAELECGRINLFVGKPNVGKSNVLEAISLLGAGYSSSKGFMSEFIRYKTINDLFFYNNIEKSILIESNIGDAQIKHIPQYGIFDFILNLNPAIEHLINYEPLFEAGETFNGGATFDLNGNKIKNELNINSMVKYYLFRPQSPIRIKGKNTFLIPPFGKNLFSVFETSARLQEEVADMFEEYRLDFVIDSYRKVFEIQRKIGKIVHKIPYHLIADTLQRIIFHYAAIFSNHSSIILFEEPESHSFPPYIRELALKIVESTENQYFITTHSPYLFNTIVEETEPEDLAIFITYFENYETKFKKLTTDDINDLLNYGVDIFFNQKWFMNEESTENPA